MGAIGLLVLCSGAAACQEATQIKLHITTDVACDSFESVGITVASVDGVELAPAAGATDRCGPDGYLGSLTVVPADDRAAAVGVRVVAGLGLGFERCAPPAYDPPGDSGGCIVARRALRFVEHSSLTLPIALLQSCIGHPCSPDTTCIDGLCAHRWPAEDGSCPDGTCTPELLAPCEVIHSCEADATSDGFVDGADAGLIISHRGTACGQQAFDPWADVNHDLVVDDLDAQAVQARMGCGCPAVCPGDATGDGLINNSDLTEVALGLGTCNAPDSGYRAQADFNGDSVVDSFDEHLVDVLSGCSCDDLCGCSRTHPCPGDVDGDGEINGLDLEELILVLGSHCGDPAYGFTADFDGDNDVDIIDLGTLEERINLSCTPR